MSEHSRCQRCGGEAYDAKHIPGQGKNHEFEPMTTPAQTPTAPVAPATEPVPPADDAGHRVREIVDPEHAVARSKGLFTYGGWKCSLGCMVSAPWEDFCGKCRQSRQVAWERAVVAERDALAARVSALEAENAKLRRLLAFSHSGAALWGV